MKSHCKIASVGKHLATEEKVEKFYLWLPRSRWPEVQRSDLRPQQCDRICTCQCYIFGLTGDHCYHFLMIFQLLGKWFKSLWQLFRIWQKNWTCFGKLFLLLGKLSFFKWSTIEEIIFVVDSFSVILFKFQFDERASHFTSLWDAIWLFLMTNQSVWRLQSLQIFNIKKNWNSVFFIPSV